LDTSRNSQRFLVNGLVNKMHRVKNDQIACHTFPRYSFDFQSELFSLQLSIFQDTVEFFDGLQALDSIYIDAVDYGRIEIRRI
jgi:hypothetical protein